MLTTVDRPPFGLACRSLSLPLFVIVRPPVVASADPLR